MTKNKKFIYLSMASIFISCGIALACVISNVLYTPAVSDPATAITSPSFEIHFISLNKSQVEGGANTLAQDARKIGAGGYVWKIEDYYYVLSSGFENRNDAVLVQNNLSSTHNIASEIITIKFDNFTLNGNFDADSKKVLEKAVKSFQDGYKNLYDIAISVDTAVYNEISARLAINSVHSQTATIKADFDTLFAGSDNSAIKSLAANLNKQVKLTESLCSGVPISNGQTYASLIKYKYIELLSLYQSLSETIKGR